jgi:UDP-N-acetylglucosamine 2-epimerase (non-hydrolysing)
MKESFRIDVVAAARPNFMKIAPLIKALSREQDWCKVRLVHTGQHYDHNMSAVFWRDLELPDPDVHLGVGSGSHAEQTASVMVAYEKLCVESRPHWTVVVGDVNSTMACAIAASKLGIRVAHLEAGLRSRDNSMPEEINRKVTDAISDVLWTPSGDADDNLLAEGVPRSSISLVGNIMIDSFELTRAKIESCLLPERLGLSRESYGVVTMHRPGNVDAPDSLSELVNLLVDVAARARLVFPVHPRTRQRLIDSGLWDSLAKVSGLMLLEPLGYIEFMSVVRNAKFVLTDSGGVQEETTYLGIPCLTLRESTERPVTVNLGTNRLVKPESVIPGVEQVLAGSWPIGRVPEFWDGHAAARIVVDLKRRSLE